MVPLLLNHNSKTQSGLKDFSRSADEPMICFGNILPMIDFHTFPVVSPWDTVRCNPMSNNDYNILGTDICWRTLGMSKDQQFILEWIF